MLFGRYKHNFDIQKQKQPGATPSTNVPFPRKGVCYWYISTGSNSRIFGFFFFFENKLSL